MNLLWVTCHEALECFSVAVPGFHLVSQDLYTLQKRIVAYEGDQDAKAFQEACFNMGHVHHLLWDHFQGEANTPKGMFAVTSKLHWLMHSALLGKYLSPRKLWCFKGEDFMRCMQHLAGSCVAGNALATSNLKMMQHWRVAAHRQWLKNS